jgi:nucleoside-diphosphate-sugar epimerase
MSSVLFLGGTGTISSACVALAVERGHDVTIVTRGASDRHEVPDGIRTLTADVRDVDALRNAVQDEEFDVVADFLSFHPDDVRDVLSVVEGHTGQYVFVSSASAYQTPPERLPVTEDTPLANPLWEYSRNKIACEDLLVAAHADRGLPMTIVRPSHTYDPTSPPVESGWTVVERMRRGAPVVVPGDGTSLWTLTHADDFARAFEPLFGHPEAIGTAFHITSDEAPTWNQIHEALATAAGVVADIVHVTSDEICAAEPGLTGSLLGDKSNSMVFDNSRIKALATGWEARIPFAEGARQIVEWHDADPSRRRVDVARDALWDRLVATRRG